MQMNKRTAAALLACLMLAGCSGENSGTYVEDEYLSDIGDHTGYVDTLTPGIDYYGCINGKKLMEGKYAVNEQRRRQDL